MKLFDSTPDIPDYDNPRLPFYERHERRIAPATVFGFTVLLTWLSFPPLRTPEFAYVFAVPALLWAYRAPSWRLYAGVVLGAHAVVWTMLLGWLHNVTWLGLLLLGPFIGVWVGAWFLLARWLLPRVIGRPAPMRMLMVFGLAALWAVNEWLRTWVLSGFPWMPLAASQWERTSILQVAAYTGAGGVSAVLMALNMGFAAAAHRLFFERHLRGLKRRSQEFFAGMFLLIACLSIHMQEAFNRAHYNLPLGRVGIVQPDVQQSLKWDPAHGPDILATLEETTLAVARRRPALILWPEAVTPWAVRGDARVQAFVEDLVRRANVPLLLGSIAMEPGDTPGDEPVWHNGVFQVTPRGGLDADYYIKRRLVPFGEFVPLRPVLGWLDKIVPLPGDFVAGTRSAPLLVNFGADWLGVGPLICYEDIFPQLARDSVRAGADLLVVQTNNGWFGRGGAAYQHAAHSVLRAVETRRPVLRVGNAGWSGWIDEFGSVRAVARMVTRRDESGRPVRVASTNPDDEGTIYFRGSAVIDLTRDSRWIGQESFYVKYGNWFVALAAVWGGLALLLGRILPPAPPPPDPDAEEVET